jgi:uncharacterized circularly permuted ATP-grasp superfamily protein/uncharacterized alpha-E superfamily protein
MSDDRLHYSPDARPAAPAGASAPLDALLPGYVVPEGHFDELLSASGRPRAHWDAFVEHAGDLSAAQLSRAQARVARQIHENGVTYNVYAAADDAPARPWALDVLPHLVPAAEWDRLARGLRQRARLLDALAADIYGDQRVLTEGRLPPALVFGHPGFLRACHGVRPPGGVFLHLLAFDLARTPDGDWHIVDARTQAPSGAGYALENRLTVSRLFPDAFRELHVDLLAPFFRTLQETLLQAAPGHGSAPFDGNASEGPPNGGGRSRGDLPGGTQRDHQAPGANDPPHIVLLTPGPLNETYFEHAYLARYLGFTLAEGGDLTVRDDRVYLKTVTGLRPVHAILRRLDDAFCDPLELRPDSTLGVPGLVQAWRAGHVLIANAIGSGLLESPALNPFLPGICTRLLDESLQLPSPGADGLADDLPLSHAPVWHAGRLESRALMLRAFLVSDGRGDYRVLPGGLTRIAGDDRQIVSSQRGGSSKDTWVLSEAPVERFSLLPGRLRAEDVTRGDRLLSSRTGENLFWLGRYAERSENGARLLRAVLSRLHQGDALVSGLSGPIVRTCLRHGLIHEPEDRRHEDRHDGSHRTWTEGSSPHDLERALIEGLFDARTYQSLAFNIEQTARVANAVRERLSSDNWRVLNQLSQKFVRRPRPRPQAAAPDAPPGMPAFERRLPGVAEALELLDEAIIALVAVGGLEMAHMTRDDGWRFLSLGRHLERLLYVTTTVGEVAAAPAVDEPALLEWLLDLSDSIITYRARYMRPPEWLAVAELLLFDDRNPRSAAFQLGKLGKHVRQLPDADLVDLLDGLERMTASHVGDPAQGELFVPSDALAGFLQSSERLALRVSDALTLRYFSHVYESPHATALL